MNEWQSMPKSRKAAGLVLLAGLLATGYAGYSVKSDIDLSAQRQFVSDCHEIQLKIEGRLQAHKQVLLGGAALFDAADSVSRHQWHAYAERVEIDQHFNGIQGLGFSLLISPNQLARHILEIRSQGFPDYTVRPAGERDIYSSIIYLEPFKDRNLRAFGYDMYSEPVRRAAMEQARNENVISLSGKVELVQETGKEVQAGTLMYAPVYRKSMPVETVEQRHAALIGWVYSPFRMDDLLHGVLKGWDDPQGRHLHLQVYDGRTIHADSLLYSNETSQEKTSKQPVLFNLEQRLDFNGREWTLHFEQLKGSVSGIDYSKVWMILAGGTGLSILAFLLMLSYLNTRRNAAWIADELTAELRKASGYARSLIEASLDPLVTISPAGKITDVNRATKKATGKSSLELIGTDFSDYFTEPDKAREGYQQVFLNGSVTDYPLTIRHQDGHVTDVLYNASLYHDEAGEVLGVFAAARDVTERNKAEAALRDALAQARRFAGALDNIPSLIYMKDLNRQYIYANKVTLKLFNCSAEELIGNGDSKFFPPETVAKLKAVDERVLERGEATMEEIDVSPHSPEWRVYLEVKYPIYDDAGKIFGLCGISTDITEHKQLEEKFRQLNSELEQRVAERTAELEAFSYSVSHDLRTPLRAIDGFSLMLLEDYGNKLDDEGKRLLNVVRNNTSRMSRLIDDILRFSRAGRIEISFSEIDMEGMARGVIEELRPLVADRKLQINLGGLPIAQGDRAMLHQVFENLLSNAIKFSGKNQEARIDIGGRIEADKAVYYVKDNGAGFDMQYAGKLFGVFQRLHGVDEFEGTGIGLAIVKRIIARHGGAAWAEGEVGKGATFYFSIPVNPEKGA